MFLRISYGLQGVIGPEVEAPGAALLQLVLLHLSLLLVKQVLNGDMQEI